MDEIDDACMAHGQTLSDFIKWAGAQYPAKKNMLLLWDHGAGSCVGLIADENYDNAIMPLYTLEKALEEGGTHFDLILTDACLMASLEMCQAVAPYADYLAASEENMAGLGTCYKKWVPYLYRRPECSALQLAKRICDLTQQAYTERDDQNTIGMFTMSVIDLSKTEPLAEAFNTFIHEVALLTQDPEALYNYAWATHYTENYSYRYMYDLFDLSRRAEEGGVSAKTVHALQDAIEDAVVYNLRSSSHIYSHGVSVYNLQNGSDMMQDHFARTSKNAEHLAYLDAVNPQWDAPDWVYEKTEKLPEMKRSNFLIKPLVTVSEDSESVWMTMETGQNAAAFISYELMRVDEASGIMFSLGRCGDIKINEDGETGAITFEPEFDGTWPTLDGMPQYVSIADDTEEYILYNIPVFINTKLFQMRVAKEYATADAEGNVEPTDFVVQGIWNEKDSHTGLPGRDVYALNELDGLEVGLCRVVYANELGRIADHIQTQDYTMKSDMTITPEALPAGDYLMRFAIEDLFGTTYYSEGFFNVNWDGKHITYSKE